MIFNILITHNIIHTCVYIYICVCVCVYKSPETWDESLLLLWHWSSHIQWRESLLLGQRSTCRFGFSLLLLRSSHPFWFWSCCGLAEWNRNAPERQLDSVWQLGSTPCHAFRTHLPPTCWKCGCSWWGNLICDTALWCLGAHRLVERDKTRGFGSLHYIILISIYFILFRKEGNIVLNMKLFDPPDSAGASQYYPFQPAELCSQKNSGARLLTSASMTPSHSFAVSYPASFHCSFILFYSQMTWWARLHCLQLYTTDPTDPTRYCLRHVARWQRHGNHALSDADVPPASWHRGIAQLSPSYTDHAGHLPGYWTWSSMEPYWLMLTRRMEKGKMWQFGDLDRSHIDMANPNFPDFDLIIYVYTYLSIYLSFYLPIFLSIYLPIFLSVYLSIYQHFSNVIVWFDSTFWNLCRLPVIAWPTHNMTGSMGHAVAFFGHGLIPTVQLVLSFLKNMCIGYQIYFPICNTHTHIYIYS